MVILHHDIIADYGENRKRERTISTLVDYGNPKEKFTAIAKTVGAPAAIAAKLVLKGELKFNRMSYSYSHRYLSKSIGRVKNFRN